MKKVVSVVTAPFRVVGRFLLKLLRPLRLRLLGTPLRPKLSRLRGKARIVVVPLAIVVVARVVICSSPRPNARAGARDARPLRGRVARQGLPDALRRPLAPELSNASAPPGCHARSRCAPALETAQNPQLEVLGVEVDGDRAARVRATRRSASRRRSTPSGSCARRRLADGLAAGSDAESAGDRSRRPQRRSITNTPPA